MRYTTGLRNFFCTCLLLLHGLAAGADEPVRVFAAASLTASLTEIASLWRRQGHPAVVLVFAGSATLAKQIAAGAPADVFASADRGWMDYLETKGKVARESRFDFLRNELVLIAPRGRGFPVRLEPGFEFAKAFEGRLCLGEPGVVPAGTYAQQALEFLQWWPSLRGRIVGTDDVRAALAFVERGECAAGIVYATDAAASRRVEVLARFPASSHAPIVYPVAFTANSPAPARAFLEFLRSTAAREVFERHGFLMLDRGR